MKEGDTFATVGNIQTVAKKIATLDDIKRKEVLMSFDTDTRIRIIEEMVNLRIQNGRNK